MDIGVSVVVGGGVAALWLVRELMHYRQRLEYTHFRQRYQVLESEWNANRKEVFHLRETNAHMQNLFKDQANALLESRKDIESRLQGVCSQTLVHAQKTFLSHLQPILSQFENSTTGQLKEQSSFLTQLVSPLEHYLQDMKQHIHALEQTRVGAYSGLKEQITHLAEGQKVLSTETNALMNAFRTPHIRGCWGEMQLRRVVELAGMVSYCDFQQHPTLATEKKHGVRPDMIIRLPGKKSIIVDAKAPMTHYLESTSAKTSADYQAKIKEHARVLSVHIKALSDKKYWSYQEHAVELTVLFLPGESFLSAALEGDANLLELAAQRNIILATPMLCIALLKTIAQGWRQDVFSQKTHRIMAMSQDLSVRLEKFHGHLLAVGKALKNGNLAYHSAISVFQETIVPTVQQLSTIVPEGASEMDATPAVSLGATALELSGLDPILSVERTREASLSVEQPSDPILPDLSDSVVLQTQDAYSAATDPEADPLFLMQAEVQEEMQAEVQEEMQAEAQEEVQEEMQEEVMPYGEHPISVEITSEYAQSKPQDPEEGTQEDNGARIDQEQYSGQSEENEMPLESESLPSPQPPFQHPQHFWVQNSAHQAGIGFPGSGFNLLSEKDRARIALESQETVSKSARDTPPFSGA